MKIFFLLVVTLLLSGCKKENNDATKNETLSSNNSLKPVLFKGMFVKDSLLLTECLSLKRYNVSPDGELIALNKVYELKSALKSSGRYYIEAEGFTSVKENSQDKKFDTLLIITKFLGLDTTHNCLKNN